MANLTSVGITSGVPSSGTGTVSTIDNLLALGVPISNGSTSLQAALTGAASSATSSMSGLVVSISPNSVNANGQATMANSAPVTLASNQTTFPVSPTAISSGGANNIIAFNTTAAPAAVAIKASGGTLYGVQAVNLSSVPSFLKIYNSSAAGVTVGSTTSGVPLITIPIPNIQTTGAGISAAFPVGIASATAISYAFTANAASSDATAVPALGTTANIQFF